MNMATIVSLYQILDIMLSQMKSKKFADIADILFNVMLNIHNIFIHGHIWEHYFALQFNNLKKSIFLFRKHLY
jgi:hypothetical protein